MKKTVWVFTLILGIFLLFSCEKTEEIIIDQNINTVRKPAANISHLNTKDIIREAKIPGRRTYNNEEEHIMICDQAYPDELCVTVYYLVPWVGFKGEGDNIVIYSESNDNYEELEIAVDKIRMDSSSNDFIYIQWQD